VSVVFGDDDGVVNEWDGISMGIVVVVLALWLFWRCGCFGVVVVLTLSLFWRCRCFGVVVVLVFLFCV
jgi:hypothetical protein